MVLIYQCETVNDIAAVRTLFREYQDWVQDPVCFEGFEYELAALPGLYQPPDGNLLICEYDYHQAGCVASRRIDAATCEMKRLYVRPGFRAAGIGHFLAEHLIDSCISQGYATMQLHTLPTMTDAIALYHSLGFNIVRPPKDAPPQHAIYMKKNLLDHSVYEF